MQQNRTAHQELKSYKKKLRQTTIHWMDSTKWVTRSKRHGH